MKKPIIFASLSFLFISLMLLAAIAATARQLEGAWQLRSGAQEPQTTRIMQDGYFMESVYDKAGKKFIRSYGGVYKVQNDQLAENVEFHTEDKEKVGSANTFTWKLNNDELQITRNGRQETWQRLDDGKGNLAGNWRITEREQNGVMRAMPQTSRKTLKLLSGTHFQWAAINPETKEFFGTGGGTYTFQNGKYTETIEFFSRDNSRVGMSLSFDGKVEGKKWHHAGLSSKGDKISEVWSRQ